MSGVSKGISVKKVINQLVQLQDLIEARAQQDAMASRGRLTQLDASIQSMTDELPPETAALFQRLHKRSRPAIVPVVGGVCAGCGMAIPVSQVHAVHAAITLHTCPACSRLLFHPEDNAPRRLPPKREAGEPVKVGIARFSSPGLMIPALQATDRDAAIAEICAVVEAAGFVNNGTRLAEEALKREAIASTAFDHGIAFPHARGVEGGGLTLALGISPKGIRFAADQRVLTRIVFLVAIPTAASAFYLRLLGGLTKTFQDETARQKLLDADSPEKLWKTMCQLTRRAIP